MDIDSEDRRDPQEETAAQPRPEPPPEMLELVEVRENPEWWRGDPGAHGEVH
jgi:hypothetical protein